MCVYIKGKKPGKIKRNRRTKIHEIFYSENVKMVKLNSALILHQLRFQCILSSAFIGTLKVASSRDGARDFSINFIFVSPSHRREVL